MSLEQRAGRLYHLDAARAIMLLLGIPFHVCEVYRVSGGFGIDSPDNSVVASFVSGLIHCFRMPAFFVLSGYFAVMMMRRKGTQAWLRGRLIRLGVPLVATMVTLGVLEEACTIWFNQPVSFPAALREAADGPLRTWVNHRWFLIVLMLYCASLAVAGRLTRFVERGDQWSGSTRGRRWLLLVAALAILAAVPFAAIFAGKALGEWTLPSPAVKQYANLYVKYGFFFLCGVIVYLAKDGLRRFSMLSATTIALGAASIALYLVTYFAFYPTDKSIVGGAAAQVILLVRIGIEALAGFYGARLFFTAVQRIFTRENGVVRYSVDASLCIYLVHEVFIITVAGHFLSVSWPPVLEIVTICSVVLAGSVLVYEIARRTPILALPLNGGPFGLRTSWARLGVTGAQASR